MTWVSKMSTIRILAASVAQRHCRAWAISRIGLLGNVREQVLRARNPTQILERLSFLGSFFHIIIGRAHSLPSTLIYSFFFVLFLLKSHPSSVILRFWRQKPRSSANLFYLYFPLADNSLRQKGMRNAIPRILEKDKEENVVRQEENKLPKLYLKMLLSHTSQVMVRKDYI